MKKKKKRKTELPVIIKSSIEYNWLWFACDEKIAGLFIFLLKISSIIKVFFMKKKKKDVVVFLQNLFYTLRHAVMGFDIKRKFISSCRNHE